MSQIDAFKRLAALEAARHQAVVDRYLAYVAHVDELTPNEVAELRTGSASGVRSEPATPDEIANAQQLWDEMVAWEVATGRTGGAA